MTSAPASFLDLPDELLYEVTRYAIKTHAEHALRDSEGHYFPAQFDKQSLDLNKKIRDHQLKALSQKFAFIEVYYYGCQLCDAHRNVAYNFNNVFQNAHGDDLLGLRHVGQVNLSTFRIDIHCPPICGNNGGPGQLLVFTEATLFAEMLICMMIQALFPYGRHIEVHVSSQSPQLNPVLDKARDIMFRYVRNATLTRSTGLATGHAQLLANIIATDVDTMTPADYANMLRHHVRDLQSMLSEGTSVDTLVPLAFWFNKAYGRPILNLDDVSGQINQDLWRYVVYLGENNIDIMMRGIATFLLSHHANCPHFYMSDDLYYLRFAAQLRGRQATIGTRDQQYLVYQNEAFLAADPMAALAEAKRRYKPEQLHKSYALVNLAVARLLTLPLSDLSRSNQGFSATYRTWRDTYIKECETSTQSAENYIMPLLWNKTLDNPFPTTPGNMTQEEFDTYYRTLMWLQYIDVLVAAVRRASPGQPARVRANGLQVLRFPILHDSAMWGPIRNLVPGEADRELKRIPLACFPASMQQNFDEILREVMTEYTMPYYSDPETLNAVHDQLEAAGLL